jgi:hypothetical protein
MELGNLNIPKLELEKISFMPNIQMRLQSIYSKLIESPIGKEVFNKIKSDQRVKVLTGQMISTGSCALSFDPKALAMWFLWAKNEFGEEIAEENLNKFLDSCKIPVINTLWVLGIEVDETIPLTNNLCITPILEMPDSCEKEYYLINSFGSIGPQQLKPKAAITCRTEIIKSYKKSDDTSTTFERNKKEFRKSSELLYDASLALNTVENTSCIPYLSTTYTLPEMPIGLFLASCGNGLLHDIIGHRVTKITVAQTGDINSVLTSLSHMPEKNKARYNRVLSRLSQSKRRELIEDKILDLGIALEMALLDDNENNQQLSLTFSLRGSWLISNNETERLSIYQQLKDIYKYRSQVAHSGVLCKNDVKKINTVRESFPNFVLIAERIIRKLICEGRPDWSKLLLGISN